MKTHTILFLAVFLTTLTPIKIFSIIHENNINDSLFSKRKSLPIPITKHEFDSLIFIDKPFYIPFSHPYIKKYIEYKFADSIIQKKTDTIEIYPEWFFKYNCQFYIDKTLREEWIYINLEAKKVKSLNYFYKSYYANGNLMYQGSSLDTKAWKKYNKNGVYLEKIKFKKIKFPLEIKHSKGIKIKTTKYNYPIDFNKIDTIKIYDFHSFRSTVNFCGCTLNKKPITKEQCIHYSKHAFLLRDIPNHLSDCDIKSCIIFVNQYDLDENLILSTYMSSAESPYYGPYTSYYSNGQIQEQGQYELFNNCADIFDRYNFPEKIGEWKYYNKKGKLKKTIDYK